MIIGNEFKQRQQNLQQQLTEQQIVILFAAPVARRNGENFYTYRQDSDFFYLTGFNEPDAIAIFTPQSYILFSAKKDPVMEVWLGPKAGQEGARNDYGASEAYAIENADQHIIELLKGIETIYTNFDVRAGISPRLQSWLAALEGKARKGINLPSHLIHIGELTHAMRLRKDSAEIALLKQAAKITATAQLNAMKFCRPGLNEAELAAILLHDFVAQGGQGIAFDPIVGGGANGCVLHYVCNDAVLSDGDLVVVDAGVEYKNYAADITRTYPVNGKFSSEQRALYQAVLTTQQEVIKHTRPGVTWKSLDELAARMVTEQLLALGILQGDLTQLIAQQAWRPFYMHHIGHWLGLDAHDVGKYQDKGEWQRLEPGMLFTVEPGIYIRAGMPNVDKKWWNIGIRIEDDVLVTENGCEVISAAVPKEIAEIEAAMAG